MVLKPEPVLRAFESIPLLAAPAGGFADEGPQAKPLQQQDLRVGRRLRPVVFSRPLRAASTSAFAVLACMRRFPIGYIFVLTAVSCPAMTVIKCALCDCFLAPSVPLLP